MYAYAFLIVSLLEVMWSHCIRFCRHTCQWYRVSSTWVPKPFWCPLKIKNTGCILHRNCKERTVTFSHVSLFNETGPSVSSSEPKMGSSCFNDITASCKIIIYKNIANLKMLSWQLPTALGAAKNATHCKPLMIQTGAMLQEKCSGHIVRVRWPQVGDLCRTKSGAFKLVVVLENDTVSVVSCVLLRNSFFSTHSRTSVTIVLDGWRSLQVSYLLHPCRRNNRFYPVSYVARASTHL